VCAVEIKYSRLYILYCFTIVLFRIAIHVVQKQRSSLFSTVLYNINQLQ